MVDFKAEDIDLFIPRNLSNDDSYHDMFIVQQFYDEYHEKLLEAGENMERTESKESSDVVSNAVPESDSATVNKFYLPTSQDRTSLPPLLCSNPSLDTSASMANESGTDLSSYLRELSVSSPGSDNETVFSEDYTAMTEVGEGSDVGTELASKTSSISSDISSAFSDPPSSRMTPTQSDGEEERLEAQNGAGNATARKNKPDIQLELGQTASPVEHYQDTPSCSLNNSPETPQKQVVDTDGHYYDDREFDFLRTEPVKRSTSLKTYKTPPGTPSRKKAVRFADALGLDLESVRHILNGNEPPRVPASAMVDLKVGMEEERKTEGIRYLSASFAQPGASSTFFQRVQAQKVLLENCVIDDKQNTITGTIRVLNIAYHKKVTVRFTVNNWLTHTDNPACYVQNSNDGPTDRFSFSISVPSYFSVGSRLQFCIHYIAGTDEFWDSNYGANYVVECYAKASPLGDKNAWVSFL